MFRVVLFLIGIVCLIEAEKKLEDIDVEFFADPANIIMERGYKSEKHIVQTEDGYLVVLYRIPHGRNTNQTNNRPILLNHGLSATAGSFLTLSAKRSIGYILADRGYDVWLLSARGTTFSNRNVRIDENNKKKFYDFTWHEIGKYDVPASIDYILKKTNHQRIQYLGHSQGGTAFLVMASERPEYQKKIILATLLATTSVMKYPNPGFKIIRPLAGFIYTLPDRLGLYDLPMSHFLRGLLQRMCKSDKYTEACAVIFDMVGGYPHHEQLDLEVFHNVFRTLPSNFAVKQLLHYLQCGTTGKFRPYDYGTKENLVRYGAPYPPEYNLTSITTPVSIFVGKNDHLVSEKDSTILSQLLPNVVNFKVIKDSRWNHGDFLFAREAMKFVYKDMLKVMSKY